VVKYGKTKRGINMNLKRLPDYERPREKLLTQGKECLNNAELLAILLRTGTREKSALELAHEVLAMNDEGLPGLFDNTPEELANIKGVGKAKACQILAAIELGRRVAAHPGKKRISISNPGDIADLFMEKMRYYKKEHFLTLLLDTKGNIIEEVEVSVGDLNSAPVHPREVFKRAVKRSAAAVVLIHNHPSGDPMPSNEDLEITLRLMESAKILGINVLDHIIIGDGVYYSMKAQGLM
jgi:DNA repair protein RadC